MLFVPALRPFLGRTTFRWSPPPRVHTLKLDSKVSVLLGSSAPRMQHGGVNRAANRETERKFLVHADQVRRLLCTSQGTHLAQGYLCSEPDRTVRVRVAGMSGFLTIKGRTHGCTRAEYEYPIPVEDARELLNTLCVQPLIEKVRYRIPAKEAGLVWEIDEFLGDNAPLILAEIELPTPETAFERPTWLADEVTLDERYYNSALQKRPYRVWGTETDDSR